MDARRPIPCQIPLSLCANIVKVLLPVRLRMRTTRSRVVFIATTGSYVAYRRAVGDRGAGVGEAARSHRTRARHSLRSIVRRWNLLPEDAYPWHVLRARTLAHMSFDQPPARGGKRCATPTSDLTRRAAERTCSGQLIGSVCHLPRAGVPGHDYAPALGFMGFTLRAALAATRARAGSRSLARATVFTSQRITEEPRDHLAQLRGRQRVGDRRGARGVHGQHGAAAFKRGWPPGWETGGHVAKWTEAGRRGGAHSCASCPSSRW